MTDTAAASWDAYIDLTGANVHVGEQLPPQLVLDVVKAVQALPGAGAVDVMVHDTAPASLSWLTLYPRSNSASSTGPAWDDRRAQVEQAVRRVTEVW